LSWQWVAGTGSSKPYLFNADNVAKYAPSNWHSPATVIDTSYEALDRLARNTTAVDHGIYSRFVGEGTPQPPLMGAPPEARWSVPDPNIAVGRDVWLLHPWSLASVPNVVGTDALLIGVGFAESHGQAPWSARRWNFVTEGLLSRTPTLWWGRVQPIAQALRGARSVGWQSEPHADRALKSLQTHLQAGQPHPVVTSFKEHSLFAPVEPFCESFAKWWRLTKIAP
jgi:deoxyribodipyrimidine photo-lyase